MFLSIQWGLRMAGHEYVRYVCCHKKEREIRRVPVLVKCDASMHCLPLAVNPKNMSLI